MRPRRTKRSNGVFRLGGGNEDNDLWCERTQQNGIPVVLSTWELTKSEREAVASGGTITLTVWGNGHPPVRLDVTESMSELSRH